MKRVITMAAVLVAFSSMVMADGHGVSGYPTVDRNVVTFETDDVFHFNFDRDVILNGSIQEANTRLREIAEYIMEKPGRMVRIEGFADETGTSDYNYNLSSRRVNALLLILASHGVSRDAIITVPYGELNPNADGHSNEAWASNRRVRVRVIAE